MKRTLDRVAGLEAEIRALKTRVAVLEAAKNGAKEKDDINALMRQVSSIVDMLRSKDHVRIAAKNELHASLLRAQLEMCGIANRVTVDVDPGDGKREG